MKKIPSIFFRDWEGDRSKVTDVHNPECQWVFDGEGVPTRKWDGTCCMTRKENGSMKLYKRFDAKFDKKLGEWKNKPVDFIPCDEPDEITGHQPGWLPIDIDAKNKKIGKENKWFIMAWDLIDPLNDKMYEKYNPKQDEGTYELVGITINGNPENINGLYYIKHGFHPLSSKYYDFTKNGITHDNLKRFFKSEEGKMEGIVWHHSDGRMAKIKRQDFGLEWPVSSQSF